MSKHFSHHKFGPLLGSPHFNKVFGRNSDDTLFGTDWSDRIYGRNGIDSLFGGLGSDKLYGGNDADFLFGGADNDYLDGGKDDDLLDGGDGDDHLIGGRGNDSLSGGAGNDFLYGDTRSSGHGKGHDASDDYLDGGDGNDFMVGGQGSDTLFGGDGNDKLFGDQTRSSNGHSDNHNSPSRDDLLEGGAGNDLIVGGEGSDSLSGGEGDDRMYGDSIRINQHHDHGHHGHNHDADDVLDGGAGSDSVYGGQGDDLVIYNVGENVDAHDYFNGGHDVDTLQINLTLEEWLDLNQTAPQLQDDFDNYLAFLADNTNPHTGQANGATFGFEALGIRATRFENFEVNVDGVQVNPADEAVTAVDDERLGTDGVLEDGPSITGSVIENDDFPDFFREVRLITDVGANNGTLTLNSDGTFEYFTDGDFQHLRAGETTTVSFVYEAEDADGDTDQATMTIEITGTNDQPIASNLSFNVGEDDATSSFITDLTGDGITEAFVATDADTLDSLSFEILSAPVDEFGHNYGEVVNNGDGTFTFNPLEHFQFLEAGETRDVTFQYVAIDDSGVGTTPTSPDETETSDVRTITVTVEGAYDAPVNASADLLFVTENQSMFATGSAIVFDDPLPFFGINETVSLTATLIPSYTVSGGALGAIWGGIASIANGFADAACDVVDFLGIADCPDPPVVPSTITTPSFGTVGSLSAQIGLQPYFTLTMGDVDASVPVSVIFTSPYQVEEGETFTIGSAYTVDGAHFETMSPDVNFGLDFVFDVAADLALAIGNSTFGGASTIPLFDFDTANISGFTGHEGLPGFNIFDFSADEDLETEIDLYGYGSLALNFPIIETDSNDAPNPSSDVLTSTGEDDIAVLTIDVDAIISELPYVPPFGDSGGDGLTISVAGETLDLFSYNYAWDVIAVDLISTLNVIQNFSLTVAELPLLVTFEDGTEVSGYSVGVDVDVTAADHFDFDPDVDGDADGLMDFSIDIDMAAIFDNLTTLGFSMEIFVGLLRLTGGFTSDFIGDESFSLFENDTATTDDDFAWSDTFSLIDNFTLATLFDDDFPIVGFEENTLTNDSLTGAYDIA